VPIDPGAWKALPFNWDRLNAERIFASRNRHGIPQMRPCYVEPEALAGFDERRVGQPDGLALYRDAGMHFFLDDYRFESLWNNPDRHRWVVERAPVLLTPDFSMYVGWPEALIAYQTYRNRWMGALWQSWGLEVIPTVGWVDHRTYDVCFAGLPRGGLVAVSTVGIHNAEQEARDLFIAGYQEMVRWVRPSKVLVYGEHWNRLGLQHEAPFRLYPPARLIHARARAQAIEAERAAARLDGHPLDVVDHTDDPW
jgi:hypothetical protein